MRWIGLMLAVGVLVGCASQPQPPGQEWYVRMASMSAVTDMCRDAGYFTSQERGAGLFFLQQYRQEVSHDPVRLTNYIAQAKDALSPIPKETCTRYAQMIEAKRLEHQQKMQAPAAPVQSNLPKQTQCSTYFGQIHCTTY